MSCPDRTVAVERFDPQDAAEGPWHAEHMARYQCVESVDVQSRLVLDLASGSGFGALFLAERGARRVVGVDPDPIAATSTHRQGKKVGIPVAGVMADGAELPFPEGTFDTAVSFETIEHVRNAGGFLDEISRVLRPGGRLYISTPNALVTNSDGGSPKNPFHVREFTPREMIDLLTPRFRIDGSMGQHLPPAYGVAPFLPSYRRGKLNLRQWINSLYWRGLLRLPPLRDRVHLALTGFPFFPRAEDYTFRTDDLNIAHVQLHVVRKEPR